MSPENSEEGSEPKPTAVAAPAAESKDEAKDTTATATAAPVAKTSEAEAADTPTAAAVAKSDKDAGQARVSDDEKADDNGEKESESEKPKAISSTPEPYPYKPPERAQAPYYPPPQAPRESSILGVPTKGLNYPFFLHNNFLLLFIFVGMIFTLIAGILSGTAIIAKDYNIYGASIICISLGLFTISTFLILAAIFRDDMNNLVRLGLLITGAIALFGIILYSRGFVPI